MSFSRGSSHMYMYIHTHIDMYIWTCVYIYIHTHIHIHMEKEMATHSSIPAWEVPWREETDRLHIVHGVARVRHDLSTKPPHTQTYNIYVYM